MNKELKTSAGKKILLVEDDREILMLLKTILEDSGFLVVPSYDGETALELLKKDKFDLVSLDIILPNLDGFAILKTIRSTTLTRNLPVLVVSGRSAMAATFMACGADGFIEKPLELKVFVSEVKNLTRDKALLVTDSHSLPEKISKIFEKFDYDVLSVENENEMVKMGKLAKYKCVLAHISCIETLPEKFRDIVANLLNYRDPTLIMLSDSDVKGLERDNAVAIEKEKVKWARAGVDKFYDSRITPSSLTSNLKTWLPQY